jgi:hypothetical protein
MKKISLIIALSLCISLITRAQLKPQSYPNVSLYNIQYNSVDSNGATPSSPYVNQYVNTGGIITGVCSYGYYLQTSNAHKWAAINVYDKTYKAAVGDSVTFTGQVTEYNKETEMDSLSNFVIVSKGNQALTPATTVALDSIQRREYQGLLVKIKDATCLRFNKPAVWWVFYDSTTINSIKCEDTIDNTLMTKQTYTPGKKYNVTGCVHFEHANWIEPRTIADIDSINVTAGIATYQNNSVNVNLFPNPNNGIFTFTISSVSEVKNVELVLLDIMGKEIYRKRTDIYTGENSIPFNLGNIAKGTYLLQMSNMQLNTISKVIIQ